MVVVVVAAAAVVVVAVRHCRSTDRGLGFRPKGIRFDRNWIAPRIRRRCDEVRLGLDRGRRNSSSPSEADPTSALGHRLFDPRRLAARIDDDDDDADRIRCPEWPLLWAWFGISLRLKRQKRNTERTKKVSSFFHPPFNNFFSPSAFAPNAVSTFSPANSCVQQ